MKVSEEEEEGWVDFRKGEEKEEEEEEDGDKGGDTLVKSHNGHSTKVSPTESPHSC